jgi:hypothetical protein
MQALVQPSSATSIDGKLRRQALTKQLSPAGLVIAKELTHVQEQAQLGITTRYIGYLALIPAMNPARSLTAHWTTGSFLRCCHGERDRVPVTLTIVQLEPRYVGKD